MLHILYVSQIILYNKCSHFYLSTNMQLLTINYLNPRCLILSYLLHTKISCLSVHWFYHLVVPPHAENKIADFLGVFISDAWRSNLKRMDG